jgi:biofilm PGA synthesis N-glycosyltransferase PgaC
MSVVLCIFWILFILYAIILVWLGIGFLLTPTFNSLNAGSTGCTIIVCARNEENNIAACLHAILSSIKQNIVQIIVVDDASADKTGNLAREILGSSGIDHLVISNPQHLGKKRSITTAISNAKHSSIVTRDADTFNEREWFSSLNAFVYSSQSDLVIGPVSFISDNSFAWAFQDIENRILTVLSCGASYFRQPFLCSGANLAFRKAVFERTGGYLKHLHIPSGDDVLFLESVKKLPGTKISFLKSPEAVVSTFTEKGLPGFFKQRLRWTSKFSASRNLLNLVIGFLVFAVNVIALFCLWKILISQTKTRDFIFLISLKFVVDFLLLFLAGTLMPGKRHFWWSPFVAVIYPFYACIISLLSLFIKPDWKKT